MAVFCTYFDRNYVGRGLTLYRSLARLDPGVEMWALCFDDLAMDAVRRLGQPGFRPVALADLEREDTGLRPAAQGRTPLEYYFTCTPSWIAYVLARCRPGALVAYVDADVLFFSDPSPLFDEMGIATAGVIPHGFPEHLTFLECCGLYNVGCVIVRNDHTGRAIVADWRARCIEWCHDYEDDGRYADQKYLDAWPSQFPGVHVMRHPGAGLGPWNWMARAIDLGPEVPLVDGHSLIFYHYHAFHPVGPWFYDCGLGSLYGVMPDALRRRIYGTYASQLGASRKLLRAIAPAVARERPHPRQGAVQYYRALLSGLMRRTASIHLTPSRGR